MSGAAARTSIAKKNEDNKYIRKQFGKVTTKRGQRNIHERKSSKQGSFGRLIQYTQKYFNNGVIVKAKPYVSWE